MTITDDHFHALPKPGPDTVATVRLPARHSHALDRTLVARENPRRGQFWNSLTVRAGSSG